MTKRRLEQDESKNLGEEEKWELESWRKRPILQMPAYPKVEALQAVEKRLKALPPLVQFQEVENLRRQLAEVERGERFLLQGGDCAERFLDCEEGVISRKLKVLLQMALILSYSGGVPVVKVGRIAGQYAKPRSSDYEPSPDGNGQILAFRGDCINEIDPTRREPDPERLVTGYFHAAATLNYLRGLVGAGFADLHEAKNWDLGYVKDSAVKRKYELMVADLTRALRFIDSTCGGAPHQAGTVDFFTSHEGLFLPYEAALTRLDPKTGQWHNTSAHFLWIGDRTRQLDGAHVEYFRGLRNPIGIKVGPTSVPGEILELTYALNPQNEPGKLVLITRFGADKVRSHLPPVVRAMKTAGRRVVWQCDPMHGNTFKTKVDGEEFKTRDFSKILKELLETFEMHRELGTRLGGLHFELTGEDVTECIGGPQDLEEKHLPQRYTTYCDPRLNYVQSMDLAFQIADKMLQHSQAGRSRSPSPEMETEMVL